MPVTATAATAVPAAEAAMPSAEAAVPSAEAAVPSAEVSSMFTANEDWSASTDPEYRRREKSAVQSVQ